MFMVYALCTTSFSNLYGKKAFTINSICTEMLYIWKAPEYVEKALSFYTCTLDAEARAVLCQLL